MEAGYSKLAADHALHLSNKIMKSPSNVCSSARWKGS